MLNRKDLQSFHDDLDKHLKENLPFYEKGILNNKTLPFENVEQVKKYNDELKKLETKLHKAETEFKQKNKWLVENTKNIDYVYGVAKDFEKFEENLT